MAEVTAFNPTLLAALALPNNVDYAGRMAQLDTHNIERQKALAELAYLPMQRQSQQLQSRAYLLQNGYDIGPNGQLVQTPLAKLKLQGLQDYQSYISNLGQGAQTQPQGQPQPASQGLLQNPIMNAPQQMGTEATTPEGGFGAFEPQAPSELIEPEQAPQTQTPQVQASIGRPGGALASLAAPTQQEIMTSPEVRAAYGLGDIAQVPTAINQATQRLLQQKQLEMQNVGVGQKGEQINIQKNANIQKANEANGRPTQFDEQGNAILNTSQGKTPEFPFPAPVLTKERISDANKNYSKVIEKDNDNLTDAPKAIQILDTMQAQAANFDTGFLGEARARLLTGSNAIFGNNPAQVEAANNILKLQNQFVSTYQKVDPGTGNRGTNMNISLTKEGKADIDVPNASFNDIINGFKGEITREYNSGLLRQAFKTANPNGIITPDVAKIDKAVNTLYPLQTVDRRTGKITYNEDNAQKIQQMITDGSIISEGPSLIKAAIKGKPAPDAIIGNSTQKAQTPGNLPQFTNPDSPEFLKLPSGTRFLDENGKRRIKH